MTPGHATLRAYLERHAQPEARQPFHLPARYTHVIVVPAYAESRFCLQRLRPACAGTAQRVLCILVVNAGEDAATGTHRTNAAMLAHLAQQTPLPLATSPPMALLRRADFDVLLIDRASAGHRLAKQGSVGLARAIGADMACRLLADGIVNSPWIHMTDADATPPSDHFATSDAWKCRDVVALTYPFWHACEQADDELALAMQLYEISLRYYVLGLAWAGSADARHSLGSCLAVRATAYAQVRGMPQRQAGEDFHLLAKLAKVGTVLQPTSRAVQIEARWSARVPFGTGPAVQRLHQQGAQAMTLFAPASFTLLRHWLRCLDAACSSPAPPDLSRCFATLPSTTAVHLVAALRQLDADRHLTIAWRSSDQPTVRRRHLRHWFDALRTLQFFHRLRELGVADLPWHEALQEAEFVPLAPPDALSFSMDRRLQLEVWRRQLFELESVRLGR